MPHPYFPLLVRMFRPADFGPRAVVVPLHEFDAAVATPQVPQLRVDRLADVRSGEVEYQLIAAQRSAATLRVIRPLRMSTIQVAVGVDHLRLHPDTDLHTQLMDSVNQRPQPARQLGQ